MKLNIPTQKNLLAFSAGVDSTALFFMLLEQNIPFDIAIVNYNLREQSKEEVTYALSLALEYNKQCFVHDVELESQSNFEKNARDIRYEFFEEIIEEYAYETLIMAHQLNDKLEWFLMQLGKGAGLSELLGMQEQTQKEYYTLLRPLLNISKEHLEEYLIERKVKYFYDQSNDELKYKRNFVRHEFANKFLKEFESGIKHSFEFLQKDLDSLNINYTPLIKRKKLEVFKNPQDTNILIRLIDSNLKKRGYLLSQAQREEILKQQECVIDAFAIAITDLHLWIAPVVEVKMSKEFKEKCRIAKIPKKIRPYLFEKSIEIDFLSIL